MKINYLFKFDNSSSTFLENYFAFESTMKQLQSFLFIKLI